MSMQPRPLFVALVSLVVAGAACGIENPPRTSLDQARDDAASGEPNALGRLLLAELTAEGGTAKEGKSVRARLDAAAKGGGLDRTLAIALDDDVHGQSVKAFDEWIDVLHVARDSNAAIAPLATLVAVDAVTQLASLVPRPHRIEKLLGLAPLVTSTSASGLGWRGAAGIAHLVAAADEYGRPQAERDSRRRTWIGCAPKIRIAGPFEFSPGDDDTSALEGERLGPWPAVFEGRPGASVRPRIVETESAGCISTAKSAAVGEYLAETFVTLDRTRELVLIPNDVSRVTVDDVVVHTLDRTAWGGVLVDGVVLRLAPGRHRIVWRADGSSASLEIRERDGATASLLYDVDATPAYGTKTRPEVLPDLHPALAVSKSDERDAVTDYFAARAALDDGAADVAAVVLASILGNDGEGVNVEGRPGAIIELAAQAAVRDPIWPTPKATTRAKGLFEQAALKDPELWLSPLVAIELSGEGTPPSEKVKRLAALADKSAARPNASLELLALYKELGWSVEYDKLVEVLATHFPDDPSVLRTYLHVLDEHGPLKAADALAERLADNEPDEPIVAERLLTRRDFKGALAAYEKFLAAHPDRKSIATRIDELKASFDTVDEASTRLAAKVAAETASPIDQLDYLLSRGEPHPFEKAMSLGIKKSGARPAAVVAAFELLQQTVDFAPFRLDARKVIAEHDETHKGKTVLGAAERILDYGALWIRSDGTSSFLEHEIIRVNSREAITELSRVQPKTGKALHLRVLKKDGRELESMRVAGKPDLTFPELDVGDVIETEVITHGIAPSSAFLAPRWYFAEPQIAYARSEYVVITPKGKDVLVEARAGAKPPKLSTLGAAFDVRKWRVDDAPPAPDEPEHPASADEFLPNVTFGWGMKLEEAIARAAAALKETTPIDPRIVRRANAIVAGIAPGKTADRARKVYQWVTQNIQKGTETDGRRVVVGGSGEQAAAFRVLTRALGIPSFITVAHDRLAPPPLSTLSAGDGYRHTLLMISTDEGALFMSFGGRYLPFGYVPPSARGEEAIVLRPGAPRMKMPTAGVVDGLHVEGSLDLAKNGDAEGTITLLFDGIVGASVREGIDQLTEGELLAAVESRILAADLPAVRLKKVEVVSRNELDKPLGLRCDVEVPGFARAVGNGAYVLFAPFQRRLSPLVARASRLTPMVLEEADHRAVSIDLHLPANAKVLQGPVKGKKSFARDRAVVDDSFDGQLLRLRRDIDMDAERIDPGQYPAFQAFCRGADGLAVEETVLGL